MCLPIAQRFVVMVFTWASLDVMTTTPSTSMDAMRNAPLKQVIVVVEAAEGHGTNVLRYGTMGLILENTSVIKETMTMLMVVTSLDESNLDGSAMMVP